MVKQLLLIFVGTVLIVGAAVPLAQNYSPQQDTSTHLDVDGNYAFDYPANWWIDDEFDTTILTSFKPGSLPFSEFIPENETKIDIYLVPDINHPSFEAFVTQEISTIDCIIEDPLVFALDNGGQAVTITASSDWGYYNVTYVDLDIRYFQFVAYGDFTPVRGIVQSFRTITPSEYSPDETIIAPIILTVQNNDCDWG
jgi:hypothetical protein